MARLISKGVSEEHWKFNRIEKVNVEKNKQEPVNFVFDKKKLTWTYNKYFKSVYL